MEKYVVSRELAEKLKAAGFNQDSCKFWCNKGSNNWLLYNMASLNIVEGDSGYAAPLSDELLEQLPKELPGRRYLHFAQGWKRGEPSVLWSCHSNGPYQTENVDEFIDCAAEKSADALAELWLWCKENGYIQVAPVEVGDAAA